MRTADRRAQVLREIRAVKIAARIARLRQLASATARTFADAERATNLPGDEIERQMLQLLDSYRADYERGALPAAAAKPARRPRARPVLVLPTNAHSRNELVRCLVRRGSL